MMLLNPYRFASGGGSGGLAWSRTDLTPSSGWTFSVDDTVADEATSSVAAIRTVSGKTSGKWYWELAITSTGGSGSFDGFAGFLKATDPVGNMNGLPYSTRSNGAANGFTGPGSFVSGDNISFALDIDAGKVWVRKNGGSWAGGGDPAAGTTPSGSGLASGQTWHPGASSDNNGLNHKFTLLSVSAACTYAAPSGFSYIGA